MNKEKLILTIVTKIQTKIESLQGVMNSLHGSKANETKSSAGDKYETSREMLQFELDKTSNQLGKLRQQLHLLKTVSIKNVSNTVQFGSIVKTESANYFLSIPFGKVEIDDESVYTISSASPVGQSMLEKKVGECFSFNGNNFKIGSLQ